MDTEAPLQVLFSAIDYDDYVGKIGIGRIERGVAKRAMPVVVCGGESTRETPAKITRLYRYEGLQRIEVEEASGELRRHHLRAQIHEVPSIMEEESTYVVVCTRIR